MALVLKACRGDPLRVLGAHTIAGARTLQAAANPRQGKLADPAHLLLDLLANGQLHLRGQYRFGDHTGQAELCQHAGCEAFVAEVVHVQAVISPQAPVEEVVPALVVDNVHAVVFGDTAQ